MHTLETVSVDDTNLSRNEAGLASIGGIRHATVIVNTDLIAWLLVIEDRCTFDNCQKKGQQEVWKLHGEMEWKRVELLVMVVWGSGNEVLLRVLGLLQIESWGRVSCVLMVEVESATAFYRFAEHFRLAGA